jgi:hypothetical protein
MNWTWKFLIAGETIAQLKSETLSFKDVVATEVGRSVCIEKDFVDTT